MKTTFIALSSMSGIVCASDTDHTIYQLSKHQPLAIAVNPYSPIPWDKIVIAYKEKGEPEGKMEFEDYALDFLNYLSSFPADESWRGLSTHDRNIIFMGYGQEDLFPSLYDILLQYNSKSKCMEMEEKLHTRISHQHSASINQIGEFDSVSTLIYGAPRETNEKLLDKHVELFNIYKQRVIEKFKGTPAEAFVIKKLDAYDPRKAFGQEISDSIDQVYREVLVGIDSFSIEEMVDAAETLVNAEVRLEHLRSKGKDPLHVTKEIAVITRVEGLTWIKHSLYAL